MISYNFSGVLLIATVIGVVSNVNGASLDVPDKGRGPLVTVQQRPVTLQDFKEYLQPIIYNKLLRPSADSPVVQQAKAVVSEYLTESLVESVRNPPTPEQGKPQKPSLKQATNGSGTNNGGRPTGTVGSTIVQAVSGATGNRTRPSQQHVLNQVDSILQNVNGANITGIVDQALLIRAPAPVRQLVNSIMTLVLCNPFNRLWNRCSGGGNIIFGNP